MEAKKLMIGNLFIDTVGAYCQPNTIQAVESINRTGVNQWSDMGTSGCCPFDKMKPIELNEDWLLKFGFQILEENTAGKIWVKFIDGIAFDDLKIIQWLKGNKIFSRKHKEIKYLHQLQNLFVALTGEELEIKNLTNG
jgi:hypothetical protein